MQDENGVKYFRLLDNGGSGSTAMQASLGSIASQFIIDFTMKFTAETTLNYFNPLSSGVDSAASLSCSDGTLSLNKTAATITGIPDDEWVRVILSIDLDEGECYAIAYNEAGGLIGKTDIVPTDSLTKAQKYISISGACVNLAAFRAYYPTKSGLKISDVEETDGGYSVICMADDKDYDVCLAVAVYDENDRFISIDFAEATVAAGEKDTVSAAVTVKAGVKTFVWILLKL